MHTSMERNTLHYNNYTVTGVTHITLSHILSSTLHTVTRMQSHTSQCHKYTFTHIKVAQVHSHTHKATNKQSQ